MPYQEKGRWFTPPDNTQLWRFRDGDYLKSIIRKSALHFSRADEFTDSYEGSLPKALKHQQLRSLNFHEYDLNEVETQQSARFRMAQITSFANCWFMSERESASMWDFYTDDANSAAIVTTVGRVKDALEVEELPVYIGEVFYTDFDLYFDEMELSSVGAIERAAFRKNRGENQGRDLHENLRMKRKSYAFEKEVRMLVPSSNPFDYKALAGSPDYWNRILSRVETEGKDHYKVDVDLGSLIEYIKVHPSADGEYETELRDFIRSADHSDLDPNCVTQSDWARNPFQ